jgi:hypothetical protein
LQPVHNVITTRARSGQIIEIDANGATGKITVPRR